MSHFPSSLDLAQLPCLQLPPLPVSQLQREIEELAAREVRAAFSTLQATAEPVKPGSIQSCERMAIALESGPAGEVYSVWVIVQRQPPRG